MKILGISHPHSGCGFHRVVLPLGFMSDVKGLVTNVPNEEVIGTGWDIVFFNRLSVWDDNLELVKDQMNCKIIVDMDDDWKLPRNHLLYDGYEQFKPRIENNLRMADMVTCTNERLAEEIRPFNHNVHIFPNAIPFGGHQFVDDKVEDEKIRLFWCGGITHEHDLELLKNPIRRLSGHADKIKMVIGGYDDSTNGSRYVWERMVGHFTSARQLPYTIIKGTTPDKYMQLYEHADIMLIPLVQNNWSACKSNLKILEASVKSIPCIVSAVEPYINDHDAPVLWAKNQTDWFKHMNFLINNKNAREDYGQRLNEWAKEKYNLHEINKERRITFASLIQS
jgi:glycosyltransferase involved in cell wall biosynthesis